MLRNLNLKSNPIREVENSRLIILFKIPHLEVLDGRKIDCHEKVNADDMFFPNVEYIASRDHMTNLVFSSIQDHKVKERLIEELIRFMLFETFLIFIHLIDRLKYSSRCQFALSYSYLMWSARQWISGNGYSFG